MFFKIFNIPIELALCIFFGLFPTITGLIKVKDCDRHQKMLVGLVILNFISELTGVTLHFFKKVEAFTIFNNIYTLVEYLYIVLMYAYWRGYHYRIINYALIFSGISIWIVDNIIFNPLTTVNSVFRIFYSIAIVLLSINIINRFDLLINKFKNINYKSIVGITFLIYFSFKAILELFYFFGIEVTPSIINFVYALILGNLYFNYILLTIAVLCMKKKKSLSI